MNQSNYQNTATHGHRFKEYALEEVINLIHEEVKRNEEIANKFSTMQVEKYRMRSLNAGLNEAKRIINRYLNSIKKEVRNAKK
jgi:hypothetical protein